LSRQIPLLAVLVAGILAACSSKSTEPVTVGPPSNLLASSSVNQNGFVGAPVGTLPSVKVTDANGLAVSGVGVVFTLAGGGGSIGGANQTTDGNGVATLGGWTLGPNPGANTVTAAGNGVTLTGAPLTFTVNAAASQFTITLQNIGPALTPARQAAFDNAKARWQQVILGDIPDVDGGIIGNTTAACGSQDLTGTMIDDVLILFTLDSIDGPGKILGAAGPCFIRQTGRLTIVGMMKFDTADVAGIQAAGQLNDVILHEMGHVLGYGTLWDQVAFNFLSGACSTAPTYTGPNAVAAFTGQNGGTGTSIPVENFPGTPPTCPNGTRDSHWEEDVFKSEIMTGFISGIVRPLSLTSIQSLKDLGYQTNPAAADPFNLATQPTLRVQGAEAPVLDLSNDILNIPLYAVDESGRMTMLRDRR